MKEMREHEDERGKIISSSERTGKWCEWAGDRVRRWTWHWPERLAIDADFVKDVFEELRGALLYNMLDPETRLQILQKTPQETNKVFGCANSTRNRLWAWEEEQESGFSLPSWNQCYERKKIKAKISLVFVLMDLPWRISSGNTGFAR